MKQYCQLASHGNDGPISGLLASARRQMQSPLSQGRVFSVRPKHMVGALDQQRAQIDVAGLGDAELRIALAGLAATRSQAEITANIATSLEPFLAAQRQHVSQGRELTDAVDLDQRLRLWILGLRQPLDQPVICLIFTVISAICSSTGPSA